MGALDDLLAGGSGGAAPTSAPSSSALDTLLSTASPPGTGGGSALGQLFASTPQASSTTGTQPSQTAAPAKSPSLFNKIGNVVGGIASIGGETVKEAGLIPYQLGESLIDKATGSTLAPSSQWEAAHPTEAGTGLFPSQAEWTAALNRLPIAGGMIRGLQQTGEEIRHGSRAIKAYSDNPIKAGLNDLATIATVLPGVGAGLRELGGGAEAANAVTKAGAVVSKVGEAPSLPLRAVRSGLLGLAKNAAADTELLHAVEGGLPAAGAAAPSRAETLLNAEREAEIARQAGQQTGIKAALANAGARLNPNVQMAVNTAVGAESRLKSIMQDPSAYLESVEGKGASARIADMTQAEARGTLQKEVIGNLTQTLLQNPTVERISDEDLASLASAADAAHTSVPRFVKSMGFTSLTEATNGLVKSDMAFVPNGVADQLSRVLEPTKAPGVAGSILQGANRLAMVSKLALSPFTTLNRLGHAVLGSAVNPEIGESARLALTAARHGLTPEDIADVAKNTTMVKQGAVRQAALRVEAENPTRIQAITQGLLNAPANLLEKSPFLRAARAADDATRTGIWLAARHAGASPEEADLILGRTAGYFDRSTGIQRNISKAIPFYNWHKQVLMVFEHMAEARPFAFAQFVNAAARMADYNEAQGISGSNTRFGGRDINLSGLDPFSGLAASLRPQTLLSPVLKATWPVVTGVSTSGYPTSSPAGNLVGGGAQQLPASLQELIKTLPQLQALQGSAPRYGTGDIRPGVQGGGALQTATRLFGFETTSAANNQKAEAAISAAQAKDARIAAAKQRKYQAKLAANGQTNSLFSNLP